MSTPKPEFVSDPKLAEFPNIEAIARGTISGAFREWPKVKPEAKAILARLERLKAELAEAREEHKKFLDGYYGATQKVNLALGKSPVFEEIDRRRFDLGDASWYRHVVEKVEWLHSQLAAANKTIEDMVGMGPCPKCGTGISATCLGCKLAAANEWEEQASERENQLRAALEAILLMGDAVPSAKFRETARSALSPIPADVLKSRG